MKKYNAILILILTITLCVGCHLMNKIESTVEHDLEKAGVQIVDDIEKDIEKEISLTNKDKE